MTLSEASNALLGENTVYTHTLTDDQKAWTDPNANYFCISDFDDPRPKTPIVACYFEFRFEIIDPQFNDSDIAFVDTNSEINTF